MLSQEIEVIEGIPVPKEFVDLLKCSVEDIWSDDDEFFEKRDTLRADALRKYFKYYKLVPKRPVTYLLRNKEKVEQISNNFIDSLERKTKNKCKTTCENNTKSYRKETFAGNTEEINERGLGGCVSDDSICQESNGMQEKSVKLDKVKCNETSHLQDSNRKSVISLSDRKTVGLIDHGSADVLLSEDCNKSIMSFKSDDLHKLKKRKHGVSVSDSSDINIPSKQHCSRDKHKVEHTVSNRDNDSSIEKLKSYSEKINNKINVDISPVNNKVSMSLEDNLSRRECRNEWQSGKNSEESHSFSEYSFITKNGSINTPKRDTVKCIVVSDTSDENISYVVKSVVNSETPPKKISRFVSKKLHEGDSMVFSEEITSDDEAWVMQAPKDMDISSMFGQSIKLNDNFLLRDNNGKVYEGFVNPDGSKRNASLVIPSMKKKSLQLRALPVAGSIIIEEKVNVPHTMTLVLHKKKKTSLPQGLRQRHPLLGTGTNDMDNVDIMNDSELGVASIQKKKVKHRNITDAASGDVIIELKSDSCVEKEKKEKLNYINETRTEVVETVTTELWSGSSVKRKKKRKHNDKSEVGTEIIGIVSAELESTSSTQNKKKMKKKKIDSGINDLNSPDLNTKRKKKRKHNDKSEVGTEIIGIVSAELESTSSTQNKKKKKKKIDSGINDLNSPDLNTKRKKKRKHNDKSEVGTEIIGIVSAELESTSSTQNKKKKKKKKKIDSGINDLNSPDLNTKRKKKRKHNDKSEVGTEIIGIVSAELESTSSTQNKKKKKKKIDSGINDLNSPDLNTKRKKKRKHNDKSEVGTEIIGIVSAELESTSSTQNKKKKKKKKIDSGINDLNSPGLNTHSFVKKTKKKKKHSDIQDTEKQWQITLQLNWTK